MKVTRRTPATVRALAAGLSLFLVLASLPPQACVFAQDVPMERVPEADMAPGGASADLNLPAALPLADAAGDVLAGGTENSFESLPTLPAQKPMVGAAAQEREQAAAPQDPDASAKVFAPAAAARGEVSDAGERTSRAASLKVSVGAPIQRLKGRVFSLLGKNKFAAGSESKQSTDQLAAQGAAQFDGQAPARASSDSSSAVKSGFLSRALGRLKPSASARAGLSAPFSQLRQAPRILVRGAADFARRHRPFAGELDEYGGPSYRPMKFKGRVAYGMKWGLNIFGLTTIAGYVLRPVLGGLAAVMPSSLLGLFGRVELMASLGPKAISQELASAPWHLLFVQAPFLSLYEEIRYRGWDFGLAFFGLLLASRALTLASKQLNDLPDFSGMRSGAQRALAVLSKIPKFAFPAAAAISAGAFAMAHVAAWGFNPASVVLWFVSGAVLAAVAYRTRGMTAPVAAHLTYNILGLVGGLLALHYFMPIASEITRLLLATISVGSLLMTYRSYRAARKARQSQGKPSSARPGFLRRTARKLGLAALIAVLASGPIINAAHQTTAVERAAQTHGVAAKQERSALLEQIQNLKAPAPVSADAAQAGDAAAPAPAPTVAQITEQVKPAVVMVVVRQPISLMQQLQMEVRKYLGLSVPNRFMEAIGSGSILTPQGLVVTNGHVVQMAGAGGTVMVVLSNGQRYPAKILTFSSPDRKDIAFLQLPNIGRPWPTVQIGDSSALKEGDRVIAMGHPLGLPFTVTQGVVSGLKDPDGAEPRYNPVYHDMIQTDAPITHGNSGGPLLNAQGQQIGINTAGSDGGGNVGFAIPMNDVLEALGQFLKAGNIDASWIGIVIDMTNPSAPDRGLAVESVRPGSPAAKAGIEGGDVILGAIINGHQIAFPGGPGALMFMQKVLALSTPGQNVQLIVTHQDQIKAVTITTASAEANMQ